MCFLGEGVLRRDDFSCSYVFCCSLRGMTEMIEEMLRSNVLRYKITDLNLLDVKEEC